MVMLKLILLAFDPISFSKLSTNCIKMGHNTSCSNSLCLLLPGNLALSSYSVFDDMNVNNVKTCLDAVNLVNIASLFKSEVAKSNS